MEDVATCSLCLEVFKDPVSLPCGHSFCRGCLRSVINHNHGTRAGDNKSPDSAVLFCPLCRAEVTLGPRGVDELQPNQNLCERVRKHIEAVVDKLPTEVTEPANTAPLCDMCEGETKPADSYCTNCMILYCAECQSTLHPRRGPIARHRLVTIKQYLSEKSTHKAVGKPGLSEGEANVIKCREHKEPLILFCVTCERPICTKCFSGHNEHAMRDISTAYASSKAPLKKEIDRFQTIKTKLQRLQAQAIATQKDVQTKSEEEYREIEETYERCLVRLRDWREIERNKVGNKGDRLTSESLCLLKSINLLTEETECLMTSSSDLLSGSEELFLRESKELLVRMQSHSTETNLGLEDKRRKLAELRSALSRRDFRSCAVTIADSCDGESGDDDDHSAVVDRQSVGAILPELCFMEVYGRTPRNVVIEEAGGVVRDGPHRVDYHTVRTDGAQTAGRHYWEVTLTWRSVVEDPGWYVYGWSDVAAVGVRRDGSNFDDSLGFDAQSWAVWVRYSFDLNQWRYLCRHCRKDISKSKPVAHSVRSDVTHRLGLLLDIEKQTLVVVDINNNNNRLFSFRAIDGSKPLVPVVTFGSGVFQREFRLRTIDPSRLPETVTDLLQNS